MRRLSVITLVSLASLSLSGCELVSGLFNRGQDTATDPTAQPVPAQPGKQAQEEFSEPMVPAAPNAAAIASAELIQSTDPNERLQQIARSRPDPYATVPVPPAPKPAPPPTRPQGQAQPRPGQQPQGGTSPTPSSGAGQPGSKPASGSSGVSGGSGVNGGSASSPITPLPPLPQPQIASAVAVTGVVRIGGETYAIVQAPNEPTSRYVRVGQRLSNGQVLVKRIETRGAGDPTVILEENGIEVARPVGSTGGPVEGSPTASSNTVQPVGLAVPLIPQG